jgi:hypothetical protein
MPRSLGPDLPPSLVELFDGGDLAGRVGLTFLLLTVDEAGWPHMAMLSVGELVAENPRVLRGALWHSSSSTRNLEREKRGVLAFISDGSAYYVRLRTSRLPDLELGAEGRLAAFRLDVEDVLEDAVGYARLTSGVSFVLNSPDDVLARWRRTIEALRRGG